MPPLALIKNAEALEILERVNTLVIDKTGTLTEGKPRVVSVVSMPGQDEAELLRLAAGVELASEHPLAAAVAARRPGAGARSRTAESFQSHTGKGVEGKVGGRSVVIGNRAFARVAGDCRRSIR